MEQTSLFDVEITKDDSPMQDVDITTYILYYDTQELKLFKKLCKEGIKQEYRDLAQTKGNTADLILKLLKEKYGQRN